MKRFLSFISIMFIGIFLSSCEKEVSSKFTIIGTWGMIEGTIDDQVYDPLGSGQYYQTIEFKTNGTYVEEFSSSVNTGVYTYDEDNKFMQMRDSKYTYYVPVHITIHSVSEITLVLDYGETGVITKHLVKIAD